MSTIKRLLSVHKLKKHNSLPSASIDIHVDHLDLKLINKHERSQSKPTTPVSVSTPTYQSDAPISGLPITQSPTTSSASSSKSNLRHRRSGGRARAKKERAKSLEVRGAHSRQDSLERAERRRNSYEKVSVLFLDRGLHLFLP